MPNTINRTADMDIELCRWLREREANAIRLGMLRNHGNERDGWLEYASYFRESARAIEHYRNAYKRKIEECEELYRRIPITEVTQ